MMFIFFLAGTLFLVGWPFYLLRVYKRGLVEDGLDRAMWTLAWIYELGIGLFFYGLLKSCL